MENYILIGCESFWKIEPAMRILRDRIFEIENYGSRVFLDPDFKRIDLFSKKVVAIVLSDQPCGVEQMNLYPNLKTIARIGTGCDNVDIEHAKERGVIVTRISDISAEPVSEYALGLILSLCRNINVTHQGLTHYNQWNRKTGAMLSELSIGIVGLGAIGRALAKKLHLLGAKEIYGWNRTMRESVLKLKKECKVDLVSFENLMSLSDVVVLCLALNKQTKGIISREMISLMKPTAFLVNVARGALVDEEALLEALENKKIAGAALDVFSEEPPTKMKSFQKLAELSMKGCNIILTLHMANRTKNLFEQACIKVAQNVIAVLEGRLEGLDIVNYL